MNQGGVDVNCAGSPTFYTRHVCNAVASGSVAQSDIDRAARRNWSTMLRLGMFDPIEQQPMITNIGAAAVDSADGRALAQRTATESFALLKNAGLLPMDGSNGRPNVKTAKVRMIVAFRCFYVFWRR
jgi:xylan 1,4-beta-xylosidase